MGSDQASRLLESRRGTIHDKRHQEHGGGQVLGLEGQDEETDHAVGAILAVRVGKGKRQWSHEDETGQEEPAE